MWDTFPGIEVLSGQTIDHRITVKPRQRGNNPRALWVRTYLHQSLQQRLILHTDSVRKSHGIIPTATSKLSHPSSIIRTHEMHQNRREQTLA